MAERSGLTDRLLSLLGLQYDFNLNLRGDAFNAIRPELFVGRRPTIDEVEQLKNTGITHVISCLPQDTRSNVAFLDDAFQWLFIAAHDGMNHDLTPSFQAAFDFAQRARQAGDSKLLVHCEVGVSRSATLATALMMQTEQLRFFEAYCEARAIRPGVLPNIGFASQLQRFEHSLLGERADETSSLARYLHEICNVPVGIDVLQEMLIRHDYDAPTAIRAIFGGDIPRVVQGARL